ncbi:hypothetical protein Drose_32310 [Dactylosporangium roseum]|uniref:Uncharacterized protein n=1 Tax=Dactylosporangium roseum TaxID=47989 RepID=A0ABY5Z129_9ACTN|nr:hypothetical protein [Dactylosporangium roseum]UWZ35739.1 hypothetical protein Drose_32310 [Dactylosporangium roseum]
MNTNIWNAARAFVAALRVNDRESATGRVWFRSTRVCPDWCAADHRCTARHGYPSGEHRSRPLTCPTPYGNVVATRTQTINGASHIELRLSAHLDRQEAIAAKQAHLLTQGVDVVARAVMAAELQRAVAGQVRR